MLTSMKGEINNNTIVGDFNTQLTLMDRSTKQKISKETQTLNNTMDQSELLDIYIGHFTPKQRNSPFFQVHTKHSPGQITSWAINLALVNFKKMEIIPSIFSDHNAVRLDLNYRKDTIKNPDIWRLNNMLLNNQ